MPFLTRKRFCDRTHVAEDERSGTDSGEAIGLHLGHATIDGRVCLRDPCGCIQRADLDPRGRSWHARYEGGAGAAEHVENVVTGVCLVLSREPQYFIGVAEITDQQEAFARLIRKE